MTGEATSQSGGFDFDSHQHAAIEQYQKVHPLYESFAEVVRAVLTEALRSRQLKVASVEARAKTLESLGAKAGVPAEGNPNQPKYRNPLAEITDLAAARVITFFLKDIDHIDQLIRAEFHVLERTDKTALLVEEDRLGYQSVHYLVELRSNRTSLPEYSRYSGLKAEIQLRTVLQHAWAEIEHDIQYKSVETIPREIRRRFTALAGLLEIADREFQAVQAEDERLRQEARRSVAQGRLEEVEITGDALKAYLDQKLGSDGRMTESSYDWTAKMLRRLGFRNFSQIEEAIGRYDHDAVSRAVYGNRQGQLTRFEDMILAAMGEGFIEKHDWAELPWWRSSKQSLLERMRNKGITIESYVPDGSGSQAIVQDARR
jgi:ppGpp synthetase/RelA/SpoT-type nucleotidyltranferase